MCEGVYSGWMVGKCVCVCEGVYSGWMVGKCVCVCVRGCIVGGW